MNWRRGSLQNFKRQCRRKPPRCRLITVWGFAPARHERQPAPTQPRQADSEDAVTPPWPRVLHRHLEHGKLLAERQVLRRERRTWEEEHVAQDGDNAHNAYGYASLGLR